MENQWVTTTCCAQHRRHRPVSAARVSFGLVSQHSLTNPPKERMMNFNQCGAFSNVFASVKGSGCRRPHRKETTRQGRGVQSYERRRPGRRIVRAGADRSLVIDHAEYRNQSSRAIHCILSRDRVNPSQFLAAARRDLPRYETGPYDPGSLRARAISGGLKWCLPMGTGKRRVNFPSPQAHRSSAEHKAPSTAAPAVCLHEKRLPLRHRSNLL